MHSSVAPRSWRTARIEQQQRLLASTAAGPSGRSSEPRVAAGASTPAAATHVLYVHGFRSSPQSAKAIQLAEWLAQHRPEVTWWCPQLPVSPREAWELLQQGIATWPQDGTAAVIGSSLGGFYARLVAERLLPHCRCVVLNPCVQPAQELAPYVGEHPAFHDPSKTLMFTATHIEELRQLEAVEGVITVSNTGCHSRITSPQRYAAVIARGDELLDWRDMAAVFPPHELGAARLVDGGDHGLSDFGSQHVPFVLDFLGLRHRPG